MSWATLILLNVFVVFITRISGSERQFTIHVEPGREECFYEAVQKGQILDIEYQVIDGGHGDLDVNFAVVSPAGRLLVNEYKKTDSVHRQEAKEDGDYKICFDNTFSHISTKVIYFEIIVEMEDEDDDSWDENSIPRGITPEEIYEMRIEEIEEVIGRVRNGFNRIKHMQDQLRAYEARDRNIQEHNYDRVNNWSMIQITLMACVGAVQVVMVRSLFDDKSRMHRLWKRNS